MLLCAAVSLPGMCIGTFRTPIAPVIGIVGSFCSFVRSLCVRLRSRSFNRYALLCFVVLMLAVVGLAVVRCCGLFTNAKG